VGHEQELVHGVELHEPPAAAVAARKRAPPAASEHPLDEVLADTRVVQSPLVLYGQEGEALDEGAGEDADPAARGTALLIVDPHTVQARARRAALEHEAAQILRLQGRRSLPRPRLHARGEVDSAARREEARGRGIAHQAHGLARHTQAALHLGAHRNPSHEASQHVVQVGVELVAAIVAHVGAKKARADAQGDAVVGHDATIARTATAGKAADSEPGGLLAVSRDSPAIRRRCACRSTASRPAEYLLLPGGTRQ
jgi:hypothetical protein